MKPIYCILVAVVFLAQWLVPGHMIYKREKILAQGRTYKFLIEPIDPANPLTGRYLQLNFKENKIEKTTKGSYTSEFYPQVYILLQKDKDGFETVKDFQLKKPDGQDDYVRAAISGYSQFDEKIIYRITYPFENYYLDEFKAVKADTLFTRRRSDSSQPSYAIVSVLDGDAVMQDVEVNGKSIHEVLRKTN